jgi:hypothetical protein
MPTLQRTWTTDQNNAPSDQSSTGAQVAEVLLTFKNALKTAGWTVTQSSDGSTADSNDNWSVVGDITNGTGAHSWIVLKSPANYPSSGNYIYFGIDYYNSNAAQVDWCTATADWTGTSTSIGPAHASAANANGDNVHTGTDDTYLVPSTVENIKYHICTNTTGDFILYTSVDSTGQVHFCSFINKLSAADSTDDFPIATYFRTAGSTAAIYSSNPFIHGDMSNGSAGSARGFKYDDGTVTSTNYYQEHWGLEGSAWGSNMGSATGDDISGKFPAFPYWCTGAGNTNGKYVRGILTDIYQANYSTEAFAAIGDVQPGTGTITMGCVGSVWLPCGVAPSF